LFKLNFKFFTVYHSYYVDSMRFIDAFCLVLHCQSLLKSRQIGFVRKKFHTIENSLLQNESFIFSKFKPNVRNEIRHAERKGYSYEIVNDISWYLSFHNQFAEQKGLPRISQELLEGYSTSIIITRVKINEVIVCSHVHQTFPEIMTVRLLFSSSIRMCSGIDKSAIAEANKWLHWRDMLYFKRENFIIYDFGGYSGSLTDKNKIGIDRFKKSFGGEIVESYDYASLVYYTCSKLFYSVKKILSLIKLK
jgi:FemAB family